MLGKRTSRITFSWIIALLLAALAAYPALLYPVEEHAEDAAFFHIYRGVVFSAARADGAWFPRWVQPINAGLGGPLFSFYPPGLYYLMDTLHGLGLSHPLAWRVIAALSLLAAMAGMFGLGLTLFKRADVALVCAVCFTYAPNLIVDLFERGSPQALPVVLYPWMLWALVRLAEAPSGLRLGLASLCWAAMMLLHGASALWLLPVIAVFLISLACRSGWRPLVWGTFALLAGSLLAAFSLLPYVADRPYVQWQNNHGAAYTQPALNPVSWTTLLAPPPFFDEALGNNGMGRPLGLLHAPLLIAALPLGWATWRRRGASAAILPLGLALVGLVSVWLQTDSATPIWTAFPLLSILEFRWRLQSTMGLLAGVILGCLLAAWAPGARSSADVHGGLDPEGLRQARPLPDGALWATAAVLLVAAYVGVGLPSLYPQLLPRWLAFSPSPTVADAQAYALHNNAPGLSAFDEEKPIWRTWPFTEEEARQVAATPIANLPKQASIVMERRRTGDIKVTVDSAVPFRAALHVLYFPGWAGYIDGCRVALAPAAHTGYATLNVPAGFHTIWLRYEGTPSQHIGDGISAIVAVVLVALAIVWRGQGSPQPADHVAYLRARWWLAAGLVALVGFKAWWIDGHTTWLRWASTCDAVHGAQVQTDAWFGEAIHLCGYSVSTEQPRAGDVLRVTLYWEASRPVEGQTWSFVHLLGTDRNPQTGLPIWGQSDKEVPAGIQVKDWVPGKLYRDDYTLQIPRQAPPGGYQLEVGLWQPRTGERLRVRVGQSQASAGSPAEKDCLLLPGIVVRRAQGDEPVARLLGLSFLRDTSVLKEPLWTQVEQEAQGSDLVVFDAGLARWFQGRAEALDVAPDSEDKVATELKAATAQHGRVWYLAYRGADPLHRIDGWLRSLGVLVTSQEAGNLTLSCYLLPQPGSPSLRRALDLEYPGGLHLKQIDLAQAQVQYRQMIRLKLEWWADSRPPGDVVASLRLVDAQGALWAQRDAPVSDGGAHPTSMWSLREPVVGYQDLSVPPAIPPGTYHLRMVLYIRDSGQVLTPVGSNSELADLCDVKVLPAGLPPTVEEISLPHRVELHLGEGVELVGYDIPTAAVDTGQSLPIRLWWRAAGPMTMAYRARLCLVGGGDRVLSEQVADVGSAEYPTTAWARGQIVERRYTLRLGAELPSGAATVQVQLQGPDGPVGQAVQLATVDVVAPEHLFQVPSIANPRQEQVGDAVRLLGYELAGAAKAGETLQLTLYWQALAPMTASYTVFTHLVDATGQVRAGHDSIPAGGARPTSGWVQSEVIIDCHGIVLPSNLAPGSYAIEVGLYDAATGARLPVYDEAGQRLESDRIALGMVSVM